MATPVLVIGWCWGCLNWMGIKNQHLNTKATKTSLVQTDNNGCNIHLHLQIYLTAHVTKEVVTFVHNVKLQPTSFSRQ